MDAISVDQQPFTSRGWSIQSVRQAHPELIALERVSVLQRDQLDISAAIESAEQSGVPVVLCDLDQRSDWDHNTLSVPWLSLKYGGSG